MKAKKIDEKSTHGCPHVGIIPDWRVINGQVSAESRNLNAHNYLPGSPNTCDNYFWPWSCHNLGEVRNVKWTLQVWKLDLWSKPAVIKPDKDNLVKNGKWYHASHHKKQLFPHFKISYFTFYSEDNSIHPFKSSFLGVSFKKSFPSLSYSLLFLIQIIFKVPPHTHLGF